MGQQILALRIGDKYGPEYEHYLKSKFDNITFINKPFFAEMKLQWNKMCGMRFDTDEPLVVIDIDMLFMNDYEDIINYPIKKGEFLGMKSWWKDTEKPGYSLNGGFYKYYPKDCRYIFDKFYSDIDYWQEYYIKNGTTVGPVNGEQYFVEDSVKERLELKFLPQEWYGKMILHPTTKWLEECNNAYPGEYFYKDGKFNEDVKIVHFQRSHSLHELLQTTLQE